MLNTMSERQQPHHFSELPPTSGRLVFWEQTDDHWGRFVLQQLQREAKIDQPCSHQSSKTRENRIDVDQLAKQAIFVSSIGELRETVESHPASFVMAEVTLEKYRELLARVPHWRASMPLLRMAVVCLELPRRTLGEYEIFTTLFREAGITTVLSNRRELLSMIPVVLPHFSAIPHPQVSWWENAKRQ